MFFNAIPQFFSIQQLVSIEVANMTSEAIQISMVEIYVAKEQPQ